jgi:hypothetical protein
VTQTDSAASDSTASDSAASDRVGSVAEEAFKLFRALTGEATGAGEQHVCTATWCPVCQVVGFVKDNPEAVAQLSESAALFTRSLRDLIDTAMTPKEES